MTTSSEQRSSPRIPHHVPIRFHLAPDIAPEASAEGGGMQAMLLDISATGMGIHTTAKLTAGEYIHFEKGQPNWQLPPRGQVVWCLKAQEGFRAGIEFAL